MNTQTGVWTPPATLSETSNMAAFIRWLQTARGLAFSDYDALWTWSVQSPSDFWQAIWDFYDVRSPTPHTAVLEHAQMPGAVWFPGAQVNYAAQVMRHVRPDRCAIRHQAEDGTLTDLTWDEMQQQVANLAQALRGMGIGQGDRVVGYLPNTPQTIVAFLAVASVGAIWSLCAPDMGAPTVLERFRQIAPKAVFTASGSDFGGVWRDRSAEVQALLQGMDTLEHWITMDAADGVDPGQILRHDWAPLLTGDAAFAPVDVPFEHPLWVVYSSGTTGSPKPIVHGHGGIIVEHLKLQGLHCNLTSEDVFSWFTSTGWIMWNAQVAGLLLGSTIALAEGNPSYPDAGRLWRFIEAAEVTSFGSGAAWFTGCMKAGVVPRDEADLSRLRMLGATGSPLPPEAYAWVHTNVRDDLWLAPIAGGTDFAGAFLAGNPMLPVHVGEMQCRALGASVLAFDEAGNPVEDEVGELVCTVPMPSMPLYLWGDDDGERLHSSYFDTYPGVWRHGDWVKITPHGGAIIYGRSDATINRHGVRMGTADIYRVVEDFPQVADSLVVDLEYLGKPSCMILFLKLAEGEVLDDTLRQSIISGLKARVSPRHVPDMIETAPDIPYTLTGKKLEVPIKKRLLGQPMAKVATADAMSNPGCLDWYDAFARRYLGTD
ncbi:acetoacetate--CoA ligase [Thalassovita taeanensis]|uniref:Acetoacetyl-CoA synthetase n=1 Tax=Thalassovita taeanensis TaxID=657014 RepID=A0A1H9EY81_9RHOB|nr:acetoacetate--CoA ligase [Thalassovita taeanensis]SEQ30579.1 acetoacetyl-CoA synthetase [Thalassovita taeanensis]